MTDAVVFVRSVFVDVLSRPDISETDNFFDQGGTSLLALKAIHRIEQQYQVELDLEFFFDEATARHLAAQIATHAGNSAA